MTFLGENEHFSGKKGVNGISPRSSSTAPPPVLPHSSNPSLLTIGWLHRPLKSIFRCLIPEHFKTGFLKEIIKICSKILLYKSRHSKYIYRTCFGKFFLCLEVSMATTVTSQTLALVRSQSTAKARDKNRNDLAERRKYVYNCTLCLWLRPRHRHFRCAH